MAKKITAKPVYVLNGPNLNMLGKRQPEIYGRATLADVQRLMEDAASRLGLSVVFRQSNIEGELVTWIQEAREIGFGRDPQCRRLHPHVGRLARCLERRRSAVHRGPLVEYLPPRGLSSPFLCLAGGARRDLRIWPQGLCPCFGGAGRYARGEMIVAKAHGKKGPLAGGTATQQSGRLHRLRAARTANARTQRQSKHDEQA